MINWIPAETAPKDGTQILAAFKNHPGVVMAVWNGANKEWCAATPQVGSYLGVFNDWYFENEYFKPDDLEVWGEIMPRKSYE